VILIDGDPARNMFTPVYFVLCTSKTEAMYDDILHLIWRDTGKRMTPAEIVCDFKLGLISSVQRQFPNAEVVGCFFISSRQSVGASNTKAYRRKRPR
jgi:hypothetical protein